MPARGKKRHPLPCVASIPTKEYWSTDRDRLKAPASLWTCRPGKGEGGRSRKVSLLSQETSKWRCLG